MAAVIVPGHRTWSLTRSREWERTYKITFRVQCDVGDGPQVALTASGLPYPGMAWQMDNDVDPWAWCTAEVNVAPVMTNEPNEYFDLEYTFSSRPANRDQGQPLNNPLLEKPKISISFSKTTEEASHDRFGRMITNSAWEQMRGKHVEFDHGHIVVKIEQNLALVDVAVLALAYQTVNSVPMWGLPPRKIKLSNASVEELYYTPPPPVTTTLPGATTTSQLSTTTTFGQIRYFKRSLEFEVKHEGWDRDLLDEGTKVLHGRWKSVVTTSTTTPPVTTTLAGATTTTAPPTTTVAGTTTQAATTTTPPIIQPAEYQMWELTHVDQYGNMPNRFNPMHFDRYTDPKGNPTRVILNGKGVPAGSVSALNKKYLCVWPAGPVVGAPLSNTKVWVALSDSPSITWDSERTYERGDIAEITSTDLFVARDKNKGVNPISDLSEKFWHPIPSGGPFDQGIFVNTAAYNDGDQVEDAIVESAGRIHVEKYNQTDFVTYLGIPATL